MDQTVTEFSVPGKTIISGKGPVGWLFRHSLRLWYYFPLAILGTAGNTLMAGIAPILLEKAVNHVSATPPDTDMLWLLTLGVAGSQLMRIPLQFLRSACFEMVAQTMKLKVLF